jgi:hypothetical protein
MADPADPAGTAPFRACMRAFLDGRLEPGEFSRVFFDLARTSSGLAREPYLLLNRGMHLAECYTDRPDQVGGGLIGADELRAGVAEVAAELDALEGRAP